MSLLQLATGGAAPKLYVDDVFSSTLYGMTTAVQSVTTGQDLATHGGMITLKNRITAGTYPVVVNTTRGANKWLYTSATAAEATSTSSVTAFTTTGFTLGADNGAGDTNSVNYNYGSDKGVAWTFRNAPKFYTHSVVTKSAGSNATVDLSTLGTVGMVRVKRTDVAGSWYIWHRSLTAGKLLIGETTAAEATLGHITVSGTTVTLVDGVIADGTYLVEAFAHDTTTDGIIQCGSFTTDGSGNATVNIGIEPQYLMFKMSDGVDAWYIQDTMRGFDMGSADKWLAANTSNAEGSTNIGNPTATGFYIQGGAASKVHIYLAIRRPNKPPTVGTQVYNAIARTSVGAESEAGVGFVPDLVNIKRRSGASDGHFQSRLQGTSRWLNTVTTDAEGSAAGYGVTVFGMDGITLGTADAAFNTSGQTYIDHFFRRAPGFFDEVCWAATSAANRRVAHNLQVQPELIINKDRGPGVGAWYSYHKDLGRDYAIVLNNDAAKNNIATDLWGATDPTSTDFGVYEGQLYAVDDLVVSYLFATLPGISKVGSYTGNGSTQNIEMGFTTGTRFFLVKASSTTGNWVLFDSVRGIVAGNDPYLLLNSTVAEDTDEDAVDPYTGGITVNETSASNINTNGVSYIYLGIA